jgi:hypothetical protein
MNNAGPVRTPPQPANLSIKSLRLSTLRNGRKLFRIRKVAQSSDLPLVLDQVGLRDKRDGDSFHLGCDPVSPDLVEGHLSDRGKNIDVVFLGAKAEILFVVEQVVGLKALQWNSKRVQGAEGGPSIFFRRPDEKVEVMGGAHIAMRVHGHAANHHVLNLGCGERG